MNRRSDLRARGNVIVIIVIIVLLVSAGVFYLLQANDAQPRYKEIKNVTFELEYPPFDVYDLTSIEVNDLIDCLSGMDFSEYETISLIPIGDGIICTVTATDKNYELVFLKPYLIYDEKTYKLGIDEQIFKVVSHITESH